MTCIVKLMPYCVCSTIVVNVDSGGEKHNLQKLSVCSFFLPSLSTILYSFNMY